MNIEKAIERLQGSLDHDTILITRGDKEALRLGIEALKRVESERHQDAFSDRSPLPGETEE